MATVTFYPVLMPLDVANLINATIFPRAVYERRGLEHCFDVVDEIVDDALSAAPGMYDIETDHLDNRRRFLEK